MAVDAPPHPSEAPLPTLNKLGVPCVPSDIDVLRAATDWFSEFANKALSSDIDGITSLLIQSSFDSARPETADQVSVYWRDLLALTWDFRTFEGTQKIRSFLTDCLANAQISSLQLKTTNDDQGLAPFFTQQSPDMAWITGMFTFETKVGLASGVFRLVPTLDQQQQLRWKAHTIFTNLEDLKGFPEKIGHLRSQSQDHGEWANLREKQRRFEDSDPAVIIIGAGQSGLEVAARLKLLGVSNLVIERNARVGDNWRNRYNPLCLHDPVWLNHMPYIPFPPNWPVFCPAKKLANWLEFYAEAMELDTWTSSAVSWIEKNNTNGYNVTVRVDKPKQFERVFSVRHVVFAVGFSGGMAFTPTYPGVEKFQGYILHSSQHKQATDHLGKKVVLIGAANSAHDLGVDYYNHGVDVTMVQRGPTHVVSVKSSIPFLTAGIFIEGGPPTVVADRIWASFPGLLNGGLNHRARQALEEADKETLEGLRRVGFRLTTGDKDPPAYLVESLRTGGHYRDVGGCQYIIDGKIKLKNDSILESFTETGLKFMDGSELRADIVVFCTGLDTARAAVKQILDPELFKNVGEIWGMDDEGEVNGIYRDLGVPNLWYMMGGLAACRFYSKHMALQIKAVEEGIFGKRYQARVCSE